jgi:hypothetical protein
MADARRTQLTEEDRWILKRAARYSITAHEIAEAFGHGDDTPWASRRLSKLVRAGYIEKADRYRYGITPDGRKEAGPLGIDWGCPGRMISGNKRGPDGHICVFNANVCTRGRGKIWFGDIDLTVDAEDLKALAAEQNDTVYVLREHDARFVTESNPRFDWAVAVVEPNGEIIIDPRK